MYCRKCGTQLEDDYDYCPMCGTKVERIKEEIRLGIEESDMDEEPKKNRSGDIIASIILLFGIYGLLTNNIFIVLPVFVIIVFLGVLFS